MAKKAKKKNPQDATLRNVRAAVKRIAALEARVADLELRLASTGASAPPV